MSATTTTDMHPNPRTGLRARFGDHRGVGPTSLPVIGWDGDGFPLVFDHRDWSLCRAHRLPGFLYVVEEVTA